MFKMNKIKTIILSILGASNVLISLLTPILLASLWIEFNNWVGWGSYLLYGIAFLSTAFRGIKFWIK